MRETAVKPALPWPLTSPSSSLLPPGLGRHSVPNTKRWKRRETTPLCEICGFAERFRPLHGALLPLPATTPEAMAGGAGSRTTSPVMPARGGSRRHFGTVPRSEPLGRAGAAFPAPRRRHEPPQRLGRRRRGRAAAPGPVSAAPTPCGKAGGCGAGRAGQAAARTARPSRGEPGRRGWPG